MTTSGSRASVAISTPTTLATVPRCVDTRGTVVLDEGQDERVIALVKTSVTYYYLGEVTLGPRASLGVVNWSKQLSVGNADDKPGAKYTIVVVVVHGADADALMGQKTMQLLPPGLATARVDIQRSDVLQNQLC